MSRLVARMQKMKSENLIGIGNHNQRKTEHHSNKDIDVERSYLNYDLINCTVNYKKDIEKFINENKSSKKAVRKDAVLISEWIITSDKEFFKEMTHQEIKRFFESSVEYFAERNGIKNIRYATVHLDESTPHMHLGIVPFDNQNKLSSKTVFNREALLDIQNTLPNFLKYKGFEIERGDENSEAKHLSVSDYKKTMQELNKHKIELEKTKWLIEDFNELAEETRQEFLENSKNYEVKESLFDKNKVVMDKEYYEMLKETALKNEVKRTYLDIGFEQTKYEVEKAKETYEELKNYLSEDLEFQNYTFDLKNKELEKREISILDREKKVEKILSDPVTIEKDNQKKLADLREDYGVLANHASEIERENINLIKKNSALVTENNLIKLKLEKLETYVLEINQVFCKFFDVFNEKISESWRNIFSGAERLVNGYFGRKMYDYENNAIPQNIKREIRKMIEDRERNRKRYNDYERFY